MFVRSSDDLENSFSYIFLASIRESIKACRKMTAALYLWDIFCCHLLTLADACSMTHRFFFMHLINKPDTEYTGQETYVWEMYSNRCWDFFPVGDCFRKQYDSEEAVS